MNLRDASYQTVRAKLKPQLQRERRQDVRVRAEAVLEALRLGSVPEAARRLGLGVRSIYKWWGRLVAGGFKLKALDPLSRRPKRSPRRIDGVIETRIFFYRRRGFGPDIIREYLRREGKTVSSSTIAHVINHRKKPVKKRRMKLKKHRRRYELPLPGERLQLDVKYSPMQVGGRTVFIYNIVDEATRWRFARGYESLNERSTIDFLDKFLAAVPFPIYVIQTDNGQEFTFKLLGEAPREHLMGVWCARHSVAHRLIPPGAKELNGKVERSHRIDADYFYGRAPTSSLELFNAALKRWIGRYNTERPHQGIGWLTPSEKLAERLATLKDAKWPGEDEKRRLRFLAEAPMMGTQEDKQFLRLQSQVRLYNLDRAG